jgi:hypothetical protein
VSSSPQPPDADRPSLLFFLYHYNDVDHIVPIAWKALQDGCRVRVVALDSSLDLGNDARIGVLLAFDRCDLDSADTILGSALAALLRRLEEVRRNPVGRILRRLVRMAATWRARRYFVSYAPDVCVFEWGGMDSRGRGPFVRAAVSLGIPRVAVPHGLNIYLDASFNPEMVRALRDGAKLRRRSNVYDRYVFQTEYHRAQDVALGLQAERTRVLGSARYCPEWQVLNLALQRPFVPGRDAGDLARVVFFTPHWSYHVHRDATLDLLRRLATTPGIYLVVKEHTRTSGRIPDAVREELELGDRCEVVSAADSVALTTWADAVVNFGSSIGIEALLQHKVHIAPRFLHSNRTIFDGFKAGIVAETAEEVVAAVRRLGRGETAGDDAGGVRDLLTAVVFGGKADRDVLRDYVDMVYELRAPAGGSGQAALAAAS